jgi:DNA (cytosine-5)-methyltransferase 1
VTLTVLDLFSGGGGFSLVGEMLGGFTTTYFVEIDPAAQSVLRDNFPGVPIHADITTFHASPGQFDVITAGFPCQDISAANYTGAGLDGERSGLFFEVIRLIRECRPRYVLLENVAALLSSNGGCDMGTVLWELSQSGYDAEWQVIPAAAVGANHLRERIWIIAYPNRDRRSGQIGDQRPRHQKGNHQTQDKGGKQELCPRVPSPALSWPPRLSGIGSVPRMDDGLSSGVGKGSTRQGRN